jgi:hypothetical protein
MPSDRPPLCVFTKRDKPWIDFLYNERVRDFCQTALLWSSTPGSRDSGTGHNPTLKVQPSFIDNDKTSRHLRVVTSFSYADLVSFSLAFFLLRKFC